jgi:hypothetical protein
MQYKMGGIFSAHKQAPSAKRTNPQFERRTCHIQNKLVAQRLGGKTKGRYKKKEIPMQSRGER